MHPWRIEAETEQNHTDGIMTSRHRAHRDDGDVTWLVRLDLWSLSIVKTWGYVFPACVILVTTTMFIQLIPLNYNPRAVHYIIDKDQYNYTLLLRQYSETSYRWSVEDSHECTDRTIALGVALALRGSYKNGYRGNIPLSHAPFFVDLLPSFCLTAIPDEYCYSFYIAYDYDDSVLSLPEGRYTFLKTLQDVAGKHHDCWKRFKINVNFVTCHHTGRPAWAQNEAMMAAYGDNMDYYFMVNDDTLFMTPSWPRHLMDALRNMNPPNVGTTGPTHHGGNEDIMTYNFAHKTHIDIFGYFYPKVFANWSADEWMTQVYEPYRSYKHPGVEVLHVREMGQRYKSTVFPRYEFEQIVNESKAILRSYLVDNHFMVIPDKPNKTVDNHLMVIPDKPNNTVDNDLMVIPDKTNQTVDNHFMVIPDKLNKTVDHNFMVIPEKTNKTEGGNEKFKRLVKSLLLPNPS